MLNIASFIKGAFFGAAVGDALGAPAEMMKAEEIQEKYGLLKDMVGGGWLNLQPGEYTDDTSMTLDVARGILADPAYPVEDIGRNFLLWFQSNPKDIGNTTRTSLQNYMRTGSWREASRLTAQSINKMDSNGGLMRTLPVTFGYWNNLQTMSKWSAEIASMTHYSPEGTTSCIFYNLLIHELKTVHETKRTVVSRTLTLTDEYCKIMGVKPDKFFWRMIKSLQEGASPVSPRGNVLDTLASSVQCFLETNNFEDALIKIVNQGEDADTAGNIVGGLAGSYYGFGAIPTRWLDALRNREEILKVTEGFIKLWQHKGFSLPQFSV